MDNCGRTVVCAGTNLSAASAKNVKNIADAGAGNRRRTKFCQHPLNPIGEGLDRVLARQKTEEIRADKNDPGRKNKRQPKRKKAFTAAQRGEVINLSALIGGQQSLMTASRGEGILTRHGWRQKKP